MGHICKHAEATPDRAAIVMADTGQTVSFQELEDRSNQAAQALRALGVGQAGHIAVLMENRPEFCELLFAAQRAGIYLTAISGYLGVQEVAYILRDCGAQVFVTSPAHAATAAAACAGSEGNGVTICTSPEALTYPGTVGKSLIGPIHIVDESGQDLPPGEVGDVYFDSGLAFSYHNDPEKTARAHHPKGWSTLGDVGYVNEDGYLFLTDRRAYTIISGGVNVYPQETEDRLLMHPAVQDAAVFGVPDDDLGETVKAVVQLVDANAAGPEMAADLIGWCRAALSGIKCPRSVDFRTHMPRTETGKLIKRKLKDEYWPAV